MRRVICCSAPHCASRPRRWGSVGSRGTIRGIHRVQRQEPRRSAVSDRPTAAAAGGLPAGRPQQAEVHLRSQRASGAPRLRRASAGRLRRTSDPAAARPPRERRRPLAASRLFPSGSAIVLPDDQLAVAIQRDLLAGIALHTHPAAPIADAVGHIVPQQATGFIILRGATLLTGGVGVILLHGPWI